jgi:hypothetical protein
MSPGKKVLKYATRVYVPRIDRIALEPDAPLECDVCCAKPTGLWFYPHRLFQVIAAGDLAQRAWILDAEAGDWAVCDDCAALVETRSLDDMVRKALQKLPGATRSLVETLYSGFLENRCGSPTYSEVRLDPLRERTRV